MELIEWSEKFSVGHMLMDTHHKVFFEMVKEFSELPNKGNHEAIKERITFLAEYAAMHLEAEEKLMLHAGYPEYGKHKAVHDAFTREVLSIQESFDKNQATITSDDILKLIQDWLVNHIMGDDMLYRPYVQKLRD